MTSPSLTAPLSLRCAIFERDGRQYLTFNGEDRDVTGWQQITITLVNGADGRCGAMVSLERGGEAEVFVVPNVEGVS